jgi:glutathione S-transferase
MRIVLNLVAVASTLMLTLMAIPSAYAQVKQAGASKVTIYHIEGSRGERVVWLCEELGIPYTLEVKRGDPAASMQQIRTVNPLMPVSPTVRYNDEILVESGAIIELLLAREGKGRFVPAVDSQDYPYYLQWLHFAEGPLAARIFSDFRVSQIQGSNAPASGPRGVTGPDTLKFANTFLGKHAFFGGKEFSGADIIMLFPIMYSERLKIAKLSDYPHIVAWQKRVEERPAFQRMVKVARPSAG